MESRSTFVTVLAWIFIVGAGFASFVSVTQVIIVSTMFSGEEFRSTPDDAPATAEFMLQYFHLFIYGFFALTLFTFVSSIALLKRKNWARLAFIVILAFGILWQVGGLVMQFVIFSDMPTPPEGEGGEGLDRMSNIILWFSFAFAIGISGLFAWIIKKLASQKIVAEFTLNNSSQQDPSKAGTSAEALNE
jgi:hypothetical protein